MTLYYTHIRVDDIARDERETRAADTGEREETGSRSQLG